MTSEQDETQDARAVNSELFLYVMYCNYLDSIVTIVTFNETRCIFKYN